MAADYARGALSPDRSTRVAEMKIRSFALPEIDCDCNTRFKISGGTDEEFISPANDLDIQAGAAATRLSQRRIASSSRKSSQVPDRATWPSTAFCRNQKMRTHQLQMTIKHHLQLDKISNLLAPEVESETNGARPAPPLQPAMRDFTDGDSRRARDMARALIASWPRADRRQNPARLLSEFLTSDMTTDTLATGGQGRAHTR